MDFELTGQQVMYAVIGIVVIILGVIFYLRHQLQSQSKEILKEHHQDESRLERVRNRNKYAEVDGLSYSGILWKLGLAISLAFILAAFNWTQYEVIKDYSMYSLEIEEELEIEPPRTSEPPPPPPPPPPPVIEEVPDEVEVEEDPPIQDQTVEKNESVAVDTVQRQVVKKAKPAPPPKKEPEKIFRRVEQMPRFPGCEDKDTEEERAKCAEVKLIQYIQGNISYTSMAQENGIEGTVVINFIVNKKGEIEDAKIVRDLQMGLGEIALKAVNKMNDMPEKWTPGRQQGKPVKVSFNLPVQFNLQ